MVADAGRTFSAASSASPSARPLKMCQMKCVPVGQLPQSGASRTRNTSAIENAAASVLEPGIARFDVVQQTDDPSRFVLVEVYRTADAPASHKATAHYAKWRDTVAGMMASPRTSVKYDNVFPGDGGR